MDALLIRKGQPAEAVLEWSQDYYDSVYNAGPGAWSRPEWRDIGTVGPTEEKFVGLHAVFPEDGNFCALTASAAYTVDWGDGVTENFAANATASHLYDYNDVDLDNTDAPVTFTASTDTVNRTAHGFVDGKTVSFWNIVTTTGITQGQIYYVINAATDTFQISATPGGTAVTLTNDGSASLTRYKQAIVTVTPQAGENLTALSLNVKHSQSGTQAYNTGWLDILVGSPNFTATGLVIGQTSTTETVPKNSIERVRIVNLGNTNTFANRFQNLRELQVIELPDTSAVTNMSNMFSACLSLRTVPLFNTASVTTMGAMFSGCISLQTVPLFNTASVTNMGNMFSECRSLQTVPLFNTASVSNMNGMFNNCSSLRTVPLFNTASVINMNSMFNNCSSLRTVPLFNTANVVNMNSMFFGCSALETVPLFNTASVVGSSSTGTSMNSMFSGCSALQTVPPFNTANVVGMSSMFNNCSALQEVPLFNTASVTTMSSMFSNCRTLQTVPLFNTASVTTMSNMFFGCSALGAVPALNTSAVTSSSNFGSIFGGCGSLARVEAKDFRFTFSVNQCKLSKTGLEEIYTNLPTVTTQQTITVSGNYGVDTAQNKASLNTTAQSATISIANTSGLALGQFVTGTGTGITTGVSVASDVSADTLTLNSHGLPDGTRVAFSALSTTTGISTWTIYYVVNSTTNDFQISLTNGGSPIDLTGTNATLTMRYPSYITNITTNTSITLDTPAATTQSGVTLTFRALDSSTALLKNWAVTF